MTEISFEIEQVQLGKKAAVVIGINEYESESIPTLSGAENDAKELSEILIKNGKFEIASNHKLIGKEAHRKAILKSVSDLFRKTAEWDFILFYFSGHGMVDEYNEGYLAPYDTDPSDPFVAGINMEDLRRAIYQSKNSASVGIMLDCCYAGIMTETTRGSNLTSKHIFADNIGKLTKSPGEGNTGIISGKFTLASSGADVESREKEYTHLDNNVAHVHGTFSYYLLEALNGAAAEKRDDGIITLQDIKSLIEDKMQDQAQLPFHSIDNASYLDNIRIALDPQKYKTQIDKYINQFQSWIRKNPSIEFIDFRK